jgi:ribosomal protein S4
MAYPAPMDELTGDRIAEAGRAAYGKHWLVPLAEGTGIGERRLRRVLNGDEKPPDDFTERLAALLERRLAEIRTELERLRLASP